jgi:serine-type D-Ala-D-Ala carboxypeptidase (penicillin-binding protein 5/6)
MKIKFDFFQLLNSLLVFMILFSLSWSLVPLMTFNHVTIKPFNHVPIPLSDGTPIPNISAKNIFILDRNSGYVLFARNADDHIYPASTTKMMTALVVYQHYPLEKIITIPFAYPEGSNLGLLPGEKLSVENLLYSMLVESANDSAEILATSFPEGLSGFVAAMNSESARLRLSDTHFLNPTGLDQVGHYSSAADLARLAGHLLDHPYLAKIVATQNAVITSDSGYRTVANVNQLLGKVNGVLGVKTGFTDLAGESLITFIKRDGHEVIISLLGSTDRFGDTEKLIDWIFSSYSWRLNL